MMAVATSLNARRIALVVDNEPARQALLALLQGTSYVLVANIDVSQGQEPLADFLDQRKDDDIDVWMVDISLHNNESVIDLLFDRTEKPMLLNDDLPLNTDLEALSLWSRRLLEKLERISVGSGASAKPTAQVASKVWVLAASLGGPEMVRRFLEALPNDLPVAFVYVQHIAAQFDRFLTEGLGKQQAYPLSLIEKEHTLIQGETLVVPADYQLRFLPFGEVLKTTVAWEGSYQPSIDQVVSELAKEYRQNVGVIIFSGTCDDGAIGCRVVKGCGGSVWVQSPDSCISPGMPEVALETGCVSYQGTPEQLAQQLTEYLSVS